MRYLFPLLMLGTMPALVGCPALGTNANRGGTAGGLLGAATGAALADENPLGGALVGGTIGAIAGAAIGDSIDADMEQQQAMVAWDGQRLANAVTVADVLSMTTSGVNSTVIVDHIKSHGSASNISTDDIIQMTQAQVDPSVIKAMQTHYSQARWPARRISPRTTHIEHHYVTPPGPFYYGHRVPHRRGLGWGFSFGN